MENIIKGVLCDLVLSEPELYVDNETRGRSGHMSHALVEYSPGHILDFNSNCSSIRAAGHSSYGWIEYRRSIDGGQKWRAVYELPYAKQAFWDGLFTVSVEKAVSCDDGTIIAFCLRNTPYTEICCMPWLTPMYVMSRDGGETWTEAKELTEYKGRIYDALYYRGSVYVLEFCNEGAIDWIGCEPDHLYRIFKSDDNGKSFYELCVVPIDGMGRGYGSMLFRPDGSLIVYAYNINNECNMDYAISYDEGKTWDKAKTCFVERRIRNPQTAILDGQYILHGRAGERGFVFYTSDDGIKWDKGHILEPDKGGCYYSNNIVLEGKDGKNRLLVQYSVSYYKNCVNIMHIWVDTPNKQ